MNKKEMSGSKFVLFSAFIVGTIFLLGGIIYTISSFMAEIGGGVPPSSTSGLLIPFGIFYSLIIGGIMASLGAIIGVIISVIIKNKKTNKIGIKKALIFFLVLFIVMTILAFSILSLMLKTEGKYEIEYEEANEFGIKKDSELVQKISIEEILFVNKPSFDSNNCIDVLYESVEEYGFEDYSYGYCKGEGSLFWKGIKHTINSTDPFSKIDQNSNLMSYEINPLYPYITYISFVSYTSESNKEYLVELVSLRATSFRSLLLIFDENGENIYEELIDGINLMEVVTTKDHGKIIILADAYDFGEEELSDFVYKIN